METYQSQNYIAPAAGSPSEIKVSAPVVHYHYIHNRLSIPVSAYLSCNNQPMSSLQGSVHWSIQSDTPLHGLQIVSDNSNNPFGAFIIADPNLPLGANANLTVTVQSSVYPHLTASARIYLILIKQEESAFGGFPSMPASSPSCLSPSPFAVTLGVGGTYQSAIFTVYSTYRSHKYYVWQELPNMAEIVVGSDITSSEGNAVLRPNKTFERNIMIRFRAEIILPTGGSVISAFTGYRFP